MLSEQVPCCVTVLDGAVRINRPVRLDAEWLSTDAVQPRVRAADGSSAQHGGQAGGRDRGPLESALDRPRNQFAHGETALTRLAASYAFGISHNHPFLDGNKRISLVVPELFLELNGYALTASDVQCVTTFLELAAGELAEDQLADWIAANSTVLA